MKTQISDLVQGSQFVAGTNQDIRNARGEQVRRENGDSLMLAIKTERGEIKVPMLLHESTTGKSWYYVSSSLSDEDCAVLGYDMSIYKYLHTADLTLYSDMRCEIRFFARRSEYCFYKQRGQQWINNQTIEIL